MAPLRCYELGLQLKDAPAIAPTPWLADTPHVAVVAEFLAAAVCNATNWDMLRLGVASEARDTDFFSPQRLSLLTEKEFIARFGPAFERPRNMVRRYRTFVAVAAVLAREEVFSLDHMVSGPVQLAGPSGLYSKLKAMPGFCGDPGQKKSRVLVQELCRTGLIVPADPENVLPAVEYHLIRLYLRTERVMPLRPTDRQKLADGAVLPLPAITSLREAVELAMYYTAGAAEVTVYDLNAMEWEIGRSYCVRSSPRCDGPPLPGKPCGDSVTELAHRVGGTCPFAAHCDGGRKEVLSRMQEPQLSRNYDYY